MGNRPAGTIGVITAELNDSYQASVWNGISVQAKAEDLGLICILGSRLNSPLIPEKSANHIYDLVNERNIDALIVVSSAISSHLETDTLRDFFESKGQLPLVSIGLKIPGVPSITVDGRAGLVSVVHHLIEKHQRRRFALVAGPVGHDEAEDRKAAFLETLSERRIPFNRDLYFEGTFEKDSGAAAVRQFVATGEPFDAVVCLNDKMALGVLDELRVNGIDVPHQVSLVGFDGIKVAEYSNPPLTTVIQPVEELGAEAVKVICGLLAMKEGEAGTVPEDRTLGCRPLIRESCGCRQRLIPSQAEAVEFGRGLSNDQLLFEDMLLDLASRLRTNDFLMRINQEVSRSLLSSDRIRWFHTLLYRVQRRIFEDQAVLENAETRDALSDLFTEAFTLLGEARSRLAASERIKLIEQHAKVRATTIAISEEFEIPVVLEQLFAGLTSLGFHDAHLVLYEGMSHPHTWSRLFSGTRNAERGNAQDDPGADGIRFRTESILPQGVSAELGQGHWVMLPLVFQHEALGYLLLPAHVVDPEHYETLGKQLASTLKGRRLLEQVRDHERRLERVVARRTEELVGTNEQLTEEIERRTRLEKEVTDISNEIIERIGQDLHDDLCQHLAGISMMVSAFQSQFERGSETAEFGGKIRGLLDDSIELARGIARSLAPVGLREEGLVVAIDALVESMRKRYPVHIHFRHEASFQFVDEERGTQLYRIVQEALMNAVKHAKCSRIDVRLSVDRTADGPSKENNGGNQGILTIEVVDNGIGFPANVPDNGMGLRIMRYRAEMAEAALTVSNLDPPAKGTRVTCTFS